MNDLKNHIYLICECCWKSMQMVAMKQLIPMELIKRFRVEMYITAEKWKNSLNISTKVERDLTLWSCTCLNITILKCNGLGQYYTVDCFITAPICITRILALSACKNHSFGNYKITALAHRYF